MGTPAGPRAVSKTRRVSQNARFLGFWQSGGCRWLAHLATNRFSGKPLSLGQPLSEALPGPNAPGKYPHPSRWNGKDSLEK